MQKTITPIDNTLYIERNYDGAKIEGTIIGSEKAQNVWADLDVKERVKLLTSFVEDFLSRSDLICEELSRQIGRPISQAVGELKGFKERADYMLSIAEKKLSNIDVAKDDNFKRNFMKEVSGKTNTLKMYRLPGNGEKNMNEFGDSITYDGDRFWCVLPSGDLVKAQYYVFNPLLMGHLYFATRPEEIEK